jgi:MarR-like DNA-binding transcriptional regulator SgrR of sgrS sRNA
MEQAVIDLVHKGLVTIDEAKARVPDLAHALDRMTAAPAKAVGR